MITSIFSLLDTGIVAGHDHIAAEDLCALIELAELEVTVTVDTRIRCASVLIAVDELADDFLFEFFLEVKDLVRDAEVHADRTCIFHVI